MLFIGISVVLFVIVFLWLLLSFPLGIIFLPKILRTDLLFALRKLRYRFTSYIASVSQMWLREPLKGVSLLLLPFFGTGATVLEVKIKETTNKRVKNVRMIIFVGLHCIGWNSTYSTALVCIVLGNPIHRSADRLHIGNF